MHEILMNFATSSDEKEASSNEIHSIRACHVKYQTGQTSSTGTTTTPKRLEQSVYQLTKRAMKSLFRINFTLLLLRSSGG